MTFIHNLQTIHSQLVVWIDMAMPLLSKGTCIYIYILYILYYIYILYIYLEAAGCSLLRWFTEGSFDFSERAPLAIRSDQVDGGLVPSGHRQVQHARERVKKMCHQLGQVRSDCSQNHGGSIMCVCKS